MRNAKHEMLMVECSNAMPHAELPNDQIPNAHTHAQLPNAKQNVQMLKCINAQMPNAQMLKRTNAQISNAQKCTNARMLKRPLPNAKSTNAQTHNCTNARMLKCTNAQMCKCSNAQMHNAQIHKCSNAQMHKLCWQIPTKTSICSYLELKTARHRKETNPSVDLDQRTTHPTTFDAK